MARARSEDPHFRLRLPAELKQRIEDAAQVNGRSINAEIIARLEAAEGIDELFGEIEKRFQQLAERVLVNAGSIMPTDQEMEIAREGRSAYQLLELLTAHPEVAKKYLAEIGKYIHDPHARTSEVLEQLVQSLYRRREVHRNYRSLRQMLAEARQHINGTVLSDHGFPEDGVRASWKLSRKDRTQLTADLAVDDELLQLLLDGNTTAALERFRQFHADMAAKKETPSPT